MSLEIDRLKSAARKQLEIYYAEMDGMDCGRHLGETINPRLNEAKTRLNSILDELSRIDPLAPKGRL